MLLKINSVKSNVYPSASTNKSSTNSNEAQSKINFKAALGGEEIIEPFFKKTGIELFKLKFPDLGLGKYLFHKEDMIARAKMSELGFKDKVLKADAKTITLEDINTKSKEELSDMITTNYEQIKL